MHDREAAAQNLSAVQMELDDLASDLLLSEISSARGHNTLRTGCHAAAPLSAPFLSAPTLQSELFNITLMPDRLTSNGWCTGKILIPQCRLSPACNNL